jgi:hypothetical protein
MNKIIISKRCDQHSFFYHARKKYKSSQLISKQLKIDKSFLIGKSLRALALLRENLVDWVNQGRPAFPMPPHRF